MLIAGDRSIAVPGGITAEGAEMLVMIRPERVRICGIDEAVADDNSLSGEVASSSFIGGTTRVTIRCDNGLNITAKMMSDRSETRPQSGARVNLCWSSADMVVLEN
ncbi:TOBE domain-containing protein [Mesorhizobium sp. M1A.F.Ca.IN.020.32.1.1]|nr:TOBE domain-containing protein [Mesorhizobium sp. M1A.F.Ca.IN.020.32.1.1]